MASSEARVRSPESNKMGNRLYVGNLSYNTTQATPRPRSPRAAKCEVAMPTDREIGQPRGFAFVTMGTASAATAAIAQPTARPSTVVCSR
ncbi:MAG: hypothetical protein U0414_27205 [Polyangiaceae bacterium]